MPARAKRNRNVVTFRRLLLAFGIATKRGTLGANRIKIYVRKFHGILGTAEPNTSHGVFELLLSTLPTGLWVVYEITSGCTCIIL